MKEPILYAHKAPNVYTAHNSFAVEIVVDIERFKKLRPNLTQRDKVESDIFYARDFATLAGVDSYGSAYDIWLKRKFGLVNRGGLNSYITAGLNLESVIARDYYMKER